MYTPHTKDEVEAMLHSIGVKNIEQLFTEIPEKFRYPELNLPERITEIEIQSEIQEIASANATTREMICFLGAGAYDHYIPAAVDALIRRGEFYTAYTPYQPEISQGTLQAIFEYQTLICALTGMDVSNASHYDGATASAEAVILAYHFYRSKRKKIVISSGLNPQYVEVINSYMQGYDDIEIMCCQSQLGSGRDIENLLDQIDQNTALLLLQYPDFLGYINDYTHIIDVAHSHGSLVAVSINPISLGILKPPGEFGADIVVGEGQPLGIPLNFGGPYLGIFATKKDLVRKLSGRLVGETRDINQELAYVLTLTAREQHIRREKSTSNICSNQGLMALASTIYLSLLGKTGLEQVSNLCYQKAHYTAERIDNLPGYSLLEKEKPFFHEFVVKCPKPVSLINYELEEKGILGGYDLSKIHPHLKNCMLVAVTEKITKDNIDYFCQSLKEIANV